MAKIRTLLSSPKANIALFVLAAVLLLGGGIGAGRAALTYFSETYSSRVEMFDIGVSLVENGDIVSYRDFDEDQNRQVDVSEQTGVLLAKMLEEGQSFQLNKKYKEELSVTNSGDIDQYVRVTIRKYWLNPDGSRNRELSPDLINLNLTNVVEADQVDAFVANNPDEDVWVHDTDSDTREIKVLYYRRVLPIGETSKIFTDTLSVDGSVADKVSQTETETKDGKVITTTYKYDGVQFRIEADVDAVQTHNDENAVHSAWGIQFSDFDLQKTESE